jgi:hypothetical protein
MIDSELAKKSVGELWNMIEERDEEIDDLRKLLKLCLPYILHSMADIDLKDTIKEIAEGKPYRIKYRKPQKGEKK